MVSPFAWISANHSKPTGRDLNEAKKNLRSICQIHRTSLLRKGHAQWQVQESRGAEHRPEDP
jgi:hypothetical protein